MHAINWSDWRSMPLAETVRQISRGLEFMAIRDVGTERYLMSQEGCGIYIFHDAEFLPLYVGEVSSRSFLERLSTHMDAHGHKGGADKGWFNTFHQHYEERYEVYGLEAKREYMAACGLLLLRMPHGDGSAIKRIERVLQHIHNPHLNCLKRGNQIGPKSTYKHALDLALQGAAAEEVANINPDLLTAVYPDWKV